MRLRPKGRDRRGTDRAGSLQTRKTDDHGFVLVGRVVIFPAARDASCSSAGGFGGFVGGEGRCGLAEARGVMRGAAKL